LAPTYGVERYIEIAGTNGGADVTHDNLIITMWQAEDKLSDADIPIVLGDILVPLYAVEAGPEAVPENQRPAFQQGMHGRVGSQFQLWVDGFGGTWGDFEGIMLVLNPPQELKQQLANSVEFLGGTPSFGADLPIPPANYNYLKPQMGQFAERFEMGGTFGPMTKIPVLIDVPASIQWGSYVPVNFFDVGAGTDPGYIPLLRTSGADGVTPEFFDMTTEAGAQACIAAVNEGNFFIPAILPIETDAIATYYEINWPYSASRG
jgi:hypothetical protein